VSIIDNCPAQSVDVKLTATKLFFFATEYKQHPAAMRPGHYTKLKIPLQKTTFEKISDLNRSNTRFRSQQSGCLPFAACCLQSREISNDKTCFIRAAFCFTPTAEPAEERKWRQH
jgi:hypothetical protein